MSLKEDSTFSILLSIGFLIAGGITAIIGHVTNCDVISCLAFGLCMGGLFNAIIGVVQMAMHIRNKY